MINTNTITIYEQPTDTALDLPNIEDVSIFNTFEVILNTYTANEDPLSKDLMLEGRSFMRFFSGKMKHLADFFEETKDQKIREKEVITVLKETIAKIEELKKVLKNPLGPSLFKKPWLVDNSVVWEKKTLKQYREIAKVHAQNEISAEPHQFAMDVLTWLDKCPKQLKHNQPALEVATPQLQQALMIPEDVQKYMRFNELNFLILITKDNIQKEAKIKKQTLNNLELFNAVEMLTEMNEEGFRQYEERLDMIQQSHLLQIAEIDRMLEGGRIRETNTVKVCNEKTMITEEMLLKTKSELLEAYRRLEEQRAYSNQLWSVIQNCQNRITDLENEDRGGCSIQ